MALQASPSSPNRIPIRSEKQGKTYIIILAEQHSPLCTFSSWEKNQYNKYNSDSFIKYIYIYIYIYIFFLGPSHRAWLFATPGTLQSVEFSRPEYWSGLTFPPPGHLSNPGIKSTSPGSPALLADSFPQSYWGNPITVSSRNSKILLEKANLDSYLKSLNFF